MIDHGRVTLDAWRATRLPVRVRRPGRPSAATILSSILAALLMAFLTFGRGLGADESAWCARNTGAVVDVAAALGIGQLLTEEAYPATTTFEVDLAAWARGETHANTDVRRACNAAYRDR